MITIGSRHIKIGKHTNDGESLLKCGSVIIDPLYNLLKITALEESNFYIDYSSNSTLLSHISYSFNGNNWMTFKKKASYDQTTNINLKKNEYIYIRGNVKYVGQVDSSGSGTFYFVLKTTSGGKLLVSGNIKSLTYQGKESAFDRDVPFALLMSDSIFIRLSFHNNLMRNILDGAFTGWRKLMSFKIPNSVKLIELFAFSNCYNLSYVFIPNSVIDIGDQAFKNCEKLTTLDVPNSVMHIGQDAFKGILNVNYRGSYSNNKPWGATFINCYIDGDFAYSDETKTTIKGYIGSSQNITIPSSVTTIGNGAFKSKTSIKSVVIGNNVTTIESEAFYECTGISILEIPDSVTSIGTNAFYNVKCITYYSSATGEPWGAKNMNVYIDGALMYSDNTKSHVIGYDSSVAGDIDIPDSVTVIDAGVFNDVTSVKITFNALYSSLTSKIISSKGTYKLEFDVSSVPSGYNAFTNMLTKGKNKNTYTYNIYTDNSTIKDQAVAFGNSYTKMNVYHLDGSAWS